MAGSWSHMTTEDGRLRNVATFHDMLDTGGDVYEAAEECFGMVQYLAEELSKHTRVGGGMFVSRSRGELVAEARNNYQAGLALGGVQPEDEAEPEVVIDPDGHPAAKRRVSRKPLADG
jgi:hypothetical protein